MKVKAHSEFDIDNLPNRLTLFRILLIPVIIGSLLFIGVFAKHKFYFEWLAAITFTIASVTDFVDGHIARKKDIITIFGSFLDPIADKFLTVSSLIALMNLHRVHALIVIVLVMREIYMTSLRLLASTEGLQVPVSALGKWKTATQMVGIPFLMISSRPMNLSFINIGSVLIYVACFLSIYSSAVYSVGLIRKLKQIRQDKRQAKKAKK